MSIFLAAVETGSLSATGRALNMPLANVSRKLSDLETHLGARLLTRTTRRLALTDAGRAYLPACKRILEDVEAAEQAAAGEYQTPKGELAITAPIVFGRLHVLPIIIEFLQAYPEISVRLTQSDRFADLLAEHVDIGLRIGDLPDSELIAIKIGAVGRVTCASPAYIEKHGAPATPKDLAAHACITFEGLMQSHLWIFDDDGAALAAPIRSRLVVNTAEAAIGAACAGLGITRVLSYQAAQAISEGALSPLLSAYAPPPAPAQLVRPNHGAPPLKVRAFLDFATPRLRARLA